MASATMRITQQSLDKVRLLSSMTGQRQQDVVDAAVEVYRRHIFLQQANAAFATTTTDQAAWKQESAERAAWDRTLLDGS